MRVMYCVYFVLAVCFIETQQQDIDLRSINNVIKAILRNDNPLIASIRAGGLLKGLYERDGAVGELFEDIEAAGKSFLIELGIKIDEEDTVEPSSVTFKSILTDPSIDKFVRNILGLKTKSESKEVPSSPPAGPAEPAKTAPSSEVTVISETSSH